MTDVSKAAAWLGCGVFVVYALLSSGFDVSEGREHRQIAERWLATGQLGSPEAMSPNFVRGIDGRYYSAHEVGNIVGMLPTLAAIRAGADLVSSESLARRAADVSMPLLAGVYASATVSAFFIIAVVGMRVDATNAFVLACACAFATTYAAYSRMLFDGVLGGAAVAWSVAAAVLAVSAQRLPLAVCAGACAGIALITRQPLLLLALVAVPYIVLESGRQRRAMLTLFALGLLPFVAWQAYYNFLRSGWPHVPAATLPQFQNLRSDGSLLAGLAGLIASPGKSVFVYSPLLVFAICGAPSAIRRSRALALSIIVFVLAYAALHAPLRNWSGEWGWGPRYVMPATMLVMLLAVPFLTRRDEVPAIRRAFVVVTALGVAVQLVALTTNWHYVYAWLTQQGKFDRSRLAWSLVDGQFVQTLLAFTDNVMRLFDASIPMRVVQGASDLNVALSNSVNVWSVTAYRAGVPLAMLIVANAALIVFATTAFRNGMAACRRCAPR